MTKEEFAQGWKLLILQPWGWRYNRVDAHGKPSGDALTQLEFYFAKLGWAHPQAWYHIAETYAQGNEWPCIDDLKRSLNSIRYRYEKEEPRRVLTTEESKKILRQITGHS